MSPRGLTRRRSLTLALAAATAAAVGLAVPGQSSAAQSGATGRHATASDTVPVQLLAFNDFHGNLDPPQGSAGSINTAFDPVTHKATASVPAGGVGYLATHLRQARQGHPRSITVTAGDMIGASPLLSGAFHDEPTVESMNLLGVGVSTVGNHEFDEGKTELLRMANGGCRTNPDGSPASDSCPEHTFQGMDFPLLSANVVNEDTGKTLLPPYYVKKFAGGVKIGFIGMTLEGTPNIVTASGVAGLQFKDEVQTANKLVPVLKRQGVKAIVVLLHEGGFPAADGLINECRGTGPGGGISGPVVDIAQGLDPQIDAVVTGHTHTAYNCNIPDPAGHSRLVTSASSFGRLFTDVELNYDKNRNDIVRSSVAGQNFIVTRDVTQATDLTSLVDDYKALIAPIANRKVGYIASEMLGRGSTAPEKPLGDFIADAQVDATQPANLGGAELALMNPGGIRADFAYPSSSAGEGDGVVTYGEAFDVQPFTNLLVTMDLSGASLLKVLQQQYSEANASSAKVLQPSAGLRYTVDNAQTGANKIVVSSIRVNGAPLDTTRSYRVTVNEFLAGGGDGFAALKDGTNRLVGVSDLDGLVDYFGKVSSPTNPVGPPSTDRITFVN